MKTTPFLASLAILAATLTTVRAQFNYATNNAEITITGYTGSDNNVTIPSSVNGYPVTAIGGFAFQGNTNVENVTIPIGVTAIGDQAFASCSSLRNITIPSSVTSIGQISFLACSSLTNVVIPFGVTAINRYTFMNCSNLKSVTIPDSVTLIGDSAFSSCTSLEDISIPNSVTEIDFAAFIHCDLLGRSQEITIPDGVTTIRAYTFYLCGNLRISLPNSVTNIEEYAFYRSGLGDTFTIPDSVTTIGNYAFGATGLKNVTIPNSVSAIGSHAFESLGLKNVTIPSSVKIIGSGAFANCFYMTSAIFLGNAPSIDGNIFDPPLFGGLGLAYYRPSTIGWGANFGGWTTVPLSEDPPVLVQDLTNKVVHAHDVVSLNVNVSGTEPLSYQWTFNGTNLSNVTSNTVLIHDVKPVNLGTYCVTVTNFYGSVTSQVVSLTMYPFLASPFAGFTTYWGQTNVLSVGAWGSGSLTYQWHFNGAVLPDATNAFYNLPAIQFTNAGLYTVVVSSEWGSVTNTPYQVIVNPANVSLKICPDVVIQGTVGYSYVIQSSTDLGNTNSWETETNVMLSTPIYNWNDNNTDVRFSPQKYYRVLPGQ